MSKTTEKQLILDQPPKVTVDGMIEHVVPRKKNENGELLFPEQDDLRQMNEAIQNSQRPVLINETPTGSIRPVQDDEND